MNSAKNGRRLAPVRLATLNVDYRHNRLTNAGVSRIFEFMDARPVRLERLSPDRDAAACRAALDLVLRGLPEPTRIGLGDGVLTSARDDPDALGELWRACDPADGATVGAVWAQLRPGGAAVVWPPQWTTPPAADEPDPLTVALLRSLTARGVTAAQSLASDRDSSEAATLLRCGFRHLADLCYLSAPAAARPAAGPLEFVPVEPADWERLAAVVDETYRETLDCPALDGSRPTANVLAEYRTIGTGGESLWRLIRSAGRDVGCLLLADHPAQDQVELVYMGLVPEVRGRNWGEATVGEALRLAQQRGRGQVVLAVDAANHPAVTMYGRAGFTTFDRRTALLFRAEWVSGKS